jgi:hypothetical protein
MDAPDFAAQGGLLRAHALFGDRLRPILDELPQVCSPHEPRGAPRRSARQDGWREPETRWSSGRMVFEYLGRSSVDQSIDRL